MQRRKTLGPVGGGLLLTRPDLLGRIYVVALCITEVSRSNTLGRITAGGYSEREKSTQALTIEESHNDIRSIGRVTPMLVS